MTNYVKGQKVVFHRHPTFNIYEILDERYINGVHEYYVAIYDTISPFNDENWWVPEDDLILYVDKICDMGCSKVGAPRHVYLCTMYDPNKN